MIDALLAQLENLLESETQLSIEIKKVFQGSLQHDCVYTLRTVSEDYTASMQHLLKWFLAYHPELVRTFWDAHLITNCMAMLDYVDDAESGVKGFMFHLSDLPAIIFNIDPDSLHLENTIKYKIKKITGEDPVFLRDGACLNIGVEFSEKQKRLLESVGFEFGDCMGHQALSVSVLKMEQLKNQMIANVTSNITMLSFNHLQIPNNQITVTGVHQYATTEYAISSLEKGNGLRLMRSYNFKNNLGVSIKQFPQLLKCLGINATPLYATFAEERQNVSWTNTAGKQWMSEHQHAYNKSGYNMRLMGVKHGNLTQMWDAEKISTAEAWDVFKKTEEEMRVGGKSVVVKNVKK